MLLMHCRPLFSAGGTRKLVVGSECLQQLQILILLLKGRFRQLQSLLLLKGLLLKW